MRQDTILFLFESPCLKYEEYIKLREGLPKQLKEILDEAYTLDKEIEYAKTLFRKMNKAPVYYVGKIIERFNKLSSLMMEYLSEYVDEDIYRDFKEEVKSIQKYIQIVLSKGLREPSYTVLYLIVALKLFLYMFVYSPLKTTKKRLNETIFKIYCDAMKRKMGLLILPSELLKESK